MASVRNLKKDINYVLGDIIEAVYEKQLTNTDADAAKGDAIIDEAIETFDALMEEVNKKDVKDAKKHFKAINAALEKKGNALIEKVNAL